VRRVRTKDSEVSSRIQWAVNVFVNVGSLGAVLSKCVDYAIFLKDTVASVFLNSNLNTGDGIFYPNADGGH
jgi:hypothetical protein